MSQSHFDLQGLKVIRDIGLDFSTHSLSCPLLEAAELLVDIHVGGRSNQVRWQRMIEIWKGRDGMLYSGCRLQSSLKWIRKNPKTSDKAGAERKIETAYNIEQEVDSFE
jgi:hypothetical protein